LDCPSGTTEYVDTVLSSSWAIWQNVLLTFSLTNPAQVFLVGWTAEPPIGMGLPEEGFAVEIDLAASTLTLTSTAGGVTAILASVALLVPVVPGVTHWLRIATDNFGFGLVEVSVWIDNVLHLVRVAAPPTVGGFLWARNTGPGVLKLDNVRLFVPPLRIDEVRP